MSSESEDEQIDLNMLDFNDPMVIQTLRMTMMEIMENEHTEKPLQQSRSRTMLRGTHTIRSVSYPYRKHSKSRVDTRRGCTLPMLEEQPEEELRQMGEPLLGNYILDYARRRVYICLSTSIVRNNYYLLKQAMLKDLHLNDRSADKLRRIWDEARIEYHKRLTQESSATSAPVTHRPDVASESHSQRRSSGIRPATTSRMQSKIPTLRSRSSQPMVRTEQATTRTSIVNVNVPINTTIGKSPKTKYPTIDFRISESELDKDDIRLKSDFWYPETNNIEYTSLKAKSSASTEAKGNTTDTSVGDMSADEIKEKANLSSSSEPAKMNPEEQGSSNVSNSSSPEQRDDSVMSDICQGLATLQLNKPTPSGSKKKETDASRPSGSGIQRDYEKYAVEDGSTDGFESIFRRKTKTGGKKRRRIKKSESSSSISTDQDIRYVKQEKTDSVNPEDSAEMLAELFRERDRQPRQLLPPPSRFTSKPVKEAEKRSGTLLHLEDVYHYPHSLKKKLTDEEYEKRVCAARRGRQLRKRLQETERERKLLQQKLVQQFVPRQTTGKQKATVKRGQASFPQPRLFLGEIEYPQPFERYNLKVRREQMLPGYIGTCEFCRMMFGCGGHQILASKNTEEQPKCQRKESDPFLMPPGRRQRLKQLEEEQRRKTLEQKTRDQDPHMKHEKHYKKDGLPKETQMKLPTGLKPSKDYYPGVEQAVSFQPRRQLSPTKEFVKQSEAAGLTHIVSPPRSIMRPYWFPERISFSHQPHHIDFPRPLPQFGVTYTDDYVCSDDDEDRVPWGKKK